MGGQGSQNRQALDGIRVLDVSTILAGPLTCQILGDFGADVIKIEHPRHGDGMRGHGLSKDGVGLWWKMIGRNKRTVGLYLGDPEGQEIFRELVRTADVVVENFRPGTLEKWGLGWESLRAVNPGLVLLRVTGFGQTGPYAGRPGFGTLAESMSGFAHLTGMPDGPPTLPAFGLADSIAGITGASAVMMALYARATGDGTGQEIDLDILEPIMTAVGPSVIYVDQLGVVQQRTGNRSLNNAPRNTYRTRDGHWVAISTSANSIAERVLTLVGHPEVTAEEWFATGAGRARHADLLDGYVTDWIGERTRAEVVDAFTAAGAAVAPVYAPDELLADPQVRALDMITQVPDPDLGSIRMQNVLFRMSGTPGAIRFTGRALGADTDQVLGGELGIGADRLAALRDRGVLR
ncbi:CoA transferase [Micromonospora sp. NPDC023956]|uniref:CaiB/BaiF CoA transferase family protein n=1 Tax=Micromonospora sp. NPDC023956 TaxID=3155722 RepID=UPI003405223C